MKKSIAALALLLLASVARGDGISNPGGSAVSIPNFTLNGGLPKWQAARAKVKAGTGNATVLIIGESTPRGWGAMFSGTVSDAASGAWPAQLAVQLRQIYGLNAQNNSIAGSGNVGNMATFVAYDTRVSNAHAWTVFNSGACTASNLFVGGCSFEAALSNTTTFDFNPKNTTTYPSAPTIPTDTLDVYTLNANQSFGFGDLKVGVNGGAALATISQNGAGASTYTKTTVSTGSAAADNTWNLASTSSGVGGAFFDAIVARNSAVKEVSIINAGIGGATAGLWATTGNAYNPLQAIQNIYQPDLCIIQEQGNDQDAGTPIATYKTNYQALITACLVTGDVLIVTSQQGEAVLVGSAPAANTTLAWAGGVVTVTTTAPHNLGTGNTPWVAIAGVTAAGYNGNYQATVTGASSFTYALAGNPGAESVPGTWAILIPPYDNQQTFAVAQQQLATTNNVPILDWWTTMCGTVSGTGASSTCSRGGWTAGIANGWNGSFNAAAQDAVHQGPYAYGPLALQISQIMMQ